MLSKIRPHWRWIGLLLFASVLSLGQFERIEFSRGAVYFHDLILCGILSWLAVKSSTWRLQQVAWWQRRTSLQKAAAAWLSLSVLLACVWSQQIFPLLYALRLVVYFLSILTLYWYSCRWSKGERHLGWALLCWTGLIWWFGILQYIFMPDTRFLFWLGWDDHYYRLISTLFDPGFTGLLLVLGLLTFLGTRQTLNWPKWGQLLVSLGAVVAILLTYSRASYVALVVGCVAAGVTIWQKHRTQKDQRRLRLIGVILVGLVGGMFLLPRPGGEGVKLERLSTVVARQENTQSVLSSLSPQEWVIGRGLFAPISQPQDATYDTPMHAQFADDWLVMILSGSGLIGLALVLAALGQYLLWSWKHHPWLSVLLVTVLVHSLFTASLIYPFVLLYWGSCSVLLTQRKKR